MHHIFLTHLISDDTPTHESDYEYTASSTCLLDECNMMEINGEIKFNPILHGLCWMLCYTGGGSTNPQGSTNPRGPVKC